MLIRLSIFFSFLSGVSNGTFLHQRPQTAVKPGNHGRELLQPDYQPYGRLRLSFIIYDTPDQANGVSRYLNRSETINPHGIHLFSFLQRVVKLRT